MGVVDKYHTAVYNPRFLKVTSNCFIHLWSNSSCILLESNYYPYHVLPTDYCISRKLITLSCYNFLSTERLLCNLLRKTLWLLDSTWKLKTEMNCYTFQQLVSTTYYHFWNYIYLLHIYIIISVYTLSPLTSSPLSIRSLSTNWQWNKIYVIVISIYTFYVPSNGIKWCTINNEIWCCAELLTVALVIKFLNKL